jgi:hypothetical protein
MKYLSNKALPWLNYRDREPSKTLLLSPNGERESLRKPGCLIMGWSLPVNSFDPFNYSILLNFSSKSKSIFELGN